MRPAVLVLSVFFWINSFGQTTAGAKVSVTIQPLEDVAGITPLLQALTLPKAPTAFDAQGIMSGNAVQRFVQEAVVTSFRVASTQAYSVSLPLETIVVKPQNNNERLRFSAFRFLPQTTRDGTAADRNVVTATIEARGQLSSGVYVSQNDVEITVHFN